ncbi:hypothetical protein R3P38DRAFT_1196266 [Favolaschia claudopus]|uniref:Uncharacterized protein n=1 Tax=Favolaschia claudopus TaxID=2862362 RepID=A0AAW0E3H0_9AGAR
MNLPGSPSQTSGIGIPRIDMPLAPATAAYCDDAPRPRRTNRHRACVASSGSSGLSLLPISRLPTRVSNRILYATKTIHHSRRMHSRLPSRCLASSRRMHDSTPSDLLSSGGLQTRRRLHRSPWSTAYRSTFPVARPGHFDCCLHPMLRLRIRAEFRSCYRHARDVSSTTSSVVAAHGSAAGQRTIDDVALPIGWEIDETGIEVFRECGG